MVWNQDTSDQARKGPGNNLVQKCYITMLFFSTLQTLIPGHQCDWSGTTLIFNISMPLCLADVEVFFFLHSIGNILALKTHLTPTLSGQKRSGRRDWEKR